MTTQDFKLPTARANAASVVLPDGRLWILGGLAAPDEREGDDNDIFASTVIVESIPHRHDLASCRVYVIFGPKTINLPS